MLIFDRDLFRMPQCSEGLVSLELLMWLEME